MKNIYFVGAPTVAKGISEFSRIAEQIEGACLYWYCYSISSDFKRRYPKVKFVTGLSDVELKKRIYRFMDLFVSCSHFEGFCLPIAEAMMEMKPVISYRLEEIESEFGNNIEYVPCFDFQNMKTKIIATLKSTPNKKKLFEAKKFVESTYSPQRVTNKLYTILGIKNV
jgi:glycosyltransferase involved in cell wall biosynthesis